jgi:hypothetical protein
MQEITQFSEHTVQLRFLLARGRCESCSKLLLPQERGRDSLCAWEAHHRNPSGGNSLGNCVILCWNCHKQTF